MAYCNNCGNIEVIDAAVEGIKVDGVCGLGEEDAREGGFGNTDDEGVSARDSGGDEGTVDRGEACFVICAGVVSSVEFMVAKLLEPEGSIKSEHAGPAQDMP